MSEKKIKTLIAEDDVFISEMYHTKLSLSDFEVDLVENGQEAVEKISQKDYDLVLLDIAMPKMNGWQVLKFIREKKKKCKVIILTNLNSKEDAEKAEKEKVDNYLVKSFFTPEEIVQKIKETLGRS